MKFLTFFIVTLITFFIVVYGSSNPEDITKKFYKRSLQW